MKRVVSSAALLLLAVLAGFAWTMVYPFASQETFGDLLWLLLSLSFLVAFHVRRGATRSLAIVIAIVSVSAAVTSLSWSLASRRLGFWYPELPPLLQRLFHTDGEASYYAMHGQLFLASFIVLMLAVLAFLRVRTRLRSSSVHVAPPPRKDGA